VTTLVPLSDDEELLFRQVHPSFVRDGRPSSQAFRPTAKDAGKLSVSRGSLTTPDRAFKLHTEGLGLRSAGTWAVSVGECREEGLNVLPDPLTSPAENQAEARGARLARKAVDRGKMHPPLSPDGPSE